MSKKISVHIDLDGRTFLMGTLWIHERNRQESASFEYSPEWRASPDSFALEPSLFVGEGTYHTEKALFGSIGDSAPDRWGRNLMKRLEAQTAKREDRPARRLKESDFLLMVNDFARQGAMRFTMDGSDFLSPSEKDMIPPIVALPRLLEASESFIENKEDYKDIRDLVEPGSSLGGARPKAVVTENDELFIAKFPKKDDDWDVPAWEYISLKMAAQCGIETPGIKLIHVLNKNVLLLNRFDRNGSIRIPFLSAMSMLDASDGEQRSYLEIVDVLSSHGAKTSEDMKELWKRMVFNIMVSNVDDHLRNHGFLYAGKSGWELSPVYDLEPTPEHVKDRFLSTYITETDGNASLELAYDVAGYFELSAKEAQAIAKDICEVTKNWHHEARKVGIKKQEIDMMASAFDHDELRLGLDPGSGFVL